jgi:hypothetical protein
MIWLMKTIVTLLTIGNDYAWLAVDPVARFALAEANCSLLSHSCLLKAKAIHVKLIGDHIDHYWCKIKEDAARAEHEKEKGEAHNRYIAAQLAKAESWDRWEMSAPIHTTIINNYGPTYNYFDHPTIIAQQCPPPPTMIPGIDAKELARKHRPTPDSELNLNMEASEILTNIACFIFGVIMLYMILHYLKGSRQGPPSPPLPPPPHPPSPLTSGI